FDASALHADALPRQAIWLVDGDELLPARAAGRAGWGPTRLYFFQAPSIDALRRCLETGASGCLEKRIAPHVLLHGLRAVGAGLFTTPPGLLLDALARPRPVLPAAIVRRGRPGAGELTGRQREIVHWAMQGLSNKQIARCLGISPETVKTHLHRAFEREGVHGRMALATLHREVRD
ncbi:MAG TPA: response regulator transcription factor, partial [Lysobacter sp.]